MLTGPFKHVFILDCSQLCGPGDCRKCAVCHLHNSSSMMFIAARMQEKIGISNYLWAFAGQASTKLKNEEMALTQQLEALTVGSCAVCVMGIPACAFIPHVLCLHID